MDVMITSNQTYMYEWKYQLEACNYLHDPVIYACVRVPHPAVVSPLPQGSLRDLIGRFLEVRIHREQAISG